MICSYAGAGGCGRRPVASNSTLIVEPSTTSSPMISPPRLRRISKAGASSTRTSSSASRSQVAKGCSPSGLRQNSVSRSILDAASGAGLFSLRDLIVHSSFSTWSFRVSIASRVMSWRSASALSSSKPMAS
jgi:hypothetical protein